MHVLTIKTRYLPASQDSHARVQADSNNGHSVSFPRDFSLSLAEFHKQVAEALALQIAVRSGHRVNTLTELTPVSTHPMGYTFRVKR